METSRSAVHDAFETHCPWEIARGLLRKVLGPDPEARPPAASREACSFIERLDAASRRFGPGNKLKRRFSVSTSPAGVTPLLRNHAPGRQAPAQQFEVGGHTPEYERIGVVS